ncbi:MAG: SDR family oxidoreductase [Clostridium sp.]|nr:SDR family oxidoreductase [Clostridium sp.]
MERKEKIVNLRGKWALVTGASRGIGKHVSLALAAQGCNLILHSRKTDSLLELQKQAREMGVETALFAQDFFEEGAADGLLAQIAKAGLQIDILVNNAGVNLSIDREQKGQSLCYADWTEEENRLTLQVNVIVPLILTSRVLSGMMERGFGRVVSLTSSICGDTNHLVYSISKGAIDKMTGDFSKSFEGLDVAVSAVDPGWCQTYLGGEGATCSPESACPGMLVPICLPEGVNGRIFRAQEYAGMTLEEAVEKESGRGR